MIRRLVLFMAILWIAGFADAKNPHWKDLPRYLKDKHVTVAEGKGTHYSGRFVSTTPDAIVIDNGHTVEIPRGSIVEITRYANGIRSAQLFFNFMSIS
jgi:hypothetical protein